MKVTVIALAVAVALLFGGLVAAGITLVGRDGQDFTSTDLVSARRAGFADGRDAGVEDGTRAGYKDGHAAGLEDGFAKGLVHGKALGFKRGEAYGIAETQAAASSAPATISEPSYTVDAQGFAICADGQTTGCWTVPSPTGNPYCEDCFRYAPDSPACWYQATDGPDEPDKDCGQGADED